MPNSSQNRYENPHLDLDSAHVFISEIEELELALAQKDHVLAQRDLTIDHYAEEVERLGEILRQFKRDVYAQRSERWVPAEQTPLFNEAKVLAAQADASTTNREEASIEVKAPTKIRGKRTPLPENLPR